MEETLVCFCNACSKELGQFINAFSVIGNNYYTPVYPMLSHKSGHGFIGTGDVRASKLGELETCFLQNLNCKYCQIFLGVRCDSAPNGHILKKHQLLLRLSEITTLVAGTNQKAQISVRNAFILESADSTAAKRSKSRVHSIGPGRSKSMSVQPAHSRPSQSSYPSMASEQPRPVQPLQPFQPPPTKSMSVEPSQLQQSQHLESSESFESPRSLLPSQPQPTTFKHSAGMPPPAAPTPKQDTSSTSPAPSGFEVWAEKEIKDQRQDIDRISGTVDRIEKTMDDMKGFMEEFRSSQTADQENQKIAASSRQMQHTAIVNMGQRLNEIEQRHKLTDNSVGLLNTNSATKDNVSRLATLIESVGHREANDISALKEEFRNMSAKIGSTSEAGWSVLRNELNTLKTKIMVLEASTKKMRSDASNAEISRLRSESSLHNKISELSNAASAEISKLRNGQGLHNNISLPSSAPAPRTEVIPMQRALELAGDPALSSSSYQPHSSASMAPPNLMYRPESQVPSYSAPPYAPQYGMPTPSYGAPSGIQLSRPVDGHLTPQLGNSGPNYVPRQPVREQAYVNHHASHEPPYGVPSTSHGSSSVNIPQPPQQIRSKQRIEVPMQQALELAGMASQASTPSYITPYAGPPPQTIYEREAISARLMQDNQEIRAVSAAIEPISSSKAATSSLSLPGRQQNAPINKGSLPVRDPTPVDTESQDVGQVENEAPPAKTPQEERPVTKLPIEFKKSIIRVEIGPLKLDQFPPIKNLEEINSAALSSPDPSDSDSDVSSIPAITKRKRTEPLSDHKGRGRVISPPTESQSKKRKVSAANTEATPRLESPEQELEHEVIDIGSSDDDEGNSPDLFVDANAIQSIETQDTESRIPVLDKGAIDLVSMLNKVAKQPFRTSFGPTASSSTITPVPRSRQLALTTQQRPTSANPTNKRPIAQINPIESLYDQNPLLNFRTQARDKLAQNGSNPTDSGGNIRKNGEVDKRPARDRRSSFQDYTSTSGGSKEKQIMPSGPAAGPSVERFRSHLQDFTAPTPQALKSRKALEQAAHHDLTTDTPVQRRAEAVMQPGYNNTHQFQEDQSIATPEQIENPFKCGVCNRRFSKSAGLRNHKNYSPACKADTSRDEMPNEFICSGCEGSFGSLQVFNKHKCPSFGNPGERADAWISNARRTVEEDERRKRIIRERDQAAKQILDGWMG